MEKPKSFKEKPGKLEKLKTLFGSKKEKKNSSSSSSSSDDEDQENNLEKMIKLASSNPTGLTPTINQKRKSFAITDKDDHNGIRPVKSSDSSSSTDDDSIIIKVEGSDSKPVLKLFERKRSQVEREKSMEKKVIPDLELELLRQKKLKFGSESDSDSSTSEDDQKKANRGPRDQLKDKMKDGKQGISVQVVTKNTTESKEKPENRKDSSSDSSDGEKNQPNAERHKPELEIKTTKPNMDVDAIMKEKLKEYRRSLSPQARHAGPISPTVFKIVRQHEDRNKPQQERKSRSSSGSSTSSSSSSESENNRKDTLKIGSQASTPELDIDAIMKHKLKEYQNSSPEHGKKSITTKFGLIPEDTGVFKIVQQKKEFVDEPARKRNKSSSSSSSSDDENKMTQGPIPSPRKRPGSLSFSVQREVDDPLTPQKRHLGDLVSRYCL